MVIAPATFCKWKAKYEGGVDVSDVQKLKTLEEEYSRLKRMHVNSEPSMSWTIVHEKFWPLGSILHCPPKALKEHCKALSLGVVNFRSSERLHRKIQPRVPRSHSKRLPIHRYLGFRALTEELIEEYNERRPHEALRNRPPSEWKQQIKP